MLYNLDKGPRKRPVSWYGQMNSRVFHYLRGWWNRIKEFIGGGGGEGRQRGCLREIDRKR